MQCPAVDEAKLRKIDKFACQLRHCRVAVGKVKGISAPTSILRFTHIESANATLSLQQTNCSVVKLVVTARLRRRAEPRLCIGR